MRCINRSGEAVHERHHVDALLLPLGRAVQDTKENPGDRMNNAARENMPIVVEELKKLQPVLGNLHEKGTLKIVGAEYHLQSGRVEFLK